MAVRPHPVRGRSQPRPHPPLGMRKWPGKPAPATGAQRCLTQPAGRCGKLRLTMRRLTRQLARPSEHAIEQMFGADPCAVLGRATPARRDLTQLGRGPSLTQVISSDASDASAIPHKTDDLDAGGPIFHGRMRLRALWTAWSVVVRVHSGALGKPRKCGVSCVWKAALGSFCMCAQYSHVRTMHTLPHTFVGVECSR
jgi:hypothetical protein